MNESAEEFVVPGLDNDDLIDLPPSAFPPYAAVLRRAARNARNFKIVAGDNVVVRARRLSPRFFFPEYSDERYSSYIRSNERGRETICGKVMRVSRYEFERIMVLDLGEGQDDQVACTLSLDALFESGEIEKIEPLQES